MNELMQDYPSLLLSEHESPCLSLYQPTHRMHPENAQDPIRFGNLVKDLEASLREKYASRDIPALLQPFHALADDADFWNHTGDGLAVLAAPGLFRVYRLQRPVTALTVVADSFHTKPLMRIVQSADRYQVLGLNKHAFKVFEGNRDALDEMAPIDSLSQDADGDSDSGAHSPSTDVKQDADSRDTKRFFRSVDRSVVAHFSRAKGQRLLLAALPQHHHLFREVSTNPHLMSEAIDVHPDDLSADALRERAWHLVQPHYLERLSGFVDAFGAAKAAERGTDDLALIAQAGIAGRVETLLIEADRIVPGRIDPVKGTIRKGQLSNPEVDDVLDDLGELVLKKGGEVVIVPAERMPTSTGAAAIYRF